MMWEWMFGPHIQLSIGDILGVLMAGYVLGFLVERKK